VSSYCGDYYRSISVYQANYCLNLPHVGIASMASLPIPAGPPTPFAAMSNSLKLTFHD